MRTYNFFVGGSKFRGIFSPNAGGIDTLVFLFWMSPSVPEIFAIKI